MAAQVLPTSHSQIFPRHEGPSDMADYVSGFDSMEHFSLPTYPSTFSGHSSPFLQSHVSDGIVYRPMSQSPRPSLFGSLTHDRTPIRHHSIDVTRNRSPSRPELLLAYASEQGQMQLDATVSTVPIVPSQTGTASAGIQEVGSYPGSLVMGSYVDPNSFLVGSPGSQAGTLASEMSSYATAMEIPAFFAGQTSMMHTPMVPTSAFGSHESSYTGEMSIQGSPGQSHSTNTGMSSVYPPISMPLEATSDEHEAASSRPKPQCWDHGCNGRQFSTFSNLLRHQREKSGNATKAVCPHCGTEFTRTTARNGHLYGGKCKVLQEKEGLQDKQSAD